LRIESSGRRRVHPGIWGRAFAATVVTALVGCAGSPERGASEAGGEPARPRAESSTKRPGGAVAEAGSAPDRLAPAVEPECATCAAAGGAEGTWCMDCEVGHAWGATTECIVCYEVLASASAGGTGWCPECDSGWIQGERSDCADCVEADRWGGRCEACAADAGAGR